MCHTPAMVPAHRTRERRTYSDGLQGYDNTDLEFCDGRMSEGFHRSRRTFILPRSLSQREMASYRWRIRWHPCVRYAGGSSLVPPDHWDAQDWNRRRPSQSMTRVWSYNCGSFVGVFGIDWQSSGDVRRFAFVLESKTVGVVDLAKIPEFVAVEGTSLV
jgi:hypothetical protein